MNKYLNYILHPSDAVMSLSAHGLLPFLSDEQYIKMKFKRRLGYSLNLENPVTFNEKIQWLKLHDRKDIYTIMVDKYEAKKYVSGIIGNEYIVPTLGVWNRFDDINFDELPNKFVLKCTHDSGGLVICRDKSNLDIASARKKINHSLKMNFYLISREWSYKNIKPKIIAEEYLEDDNTKDLRDYKFFCFNGNPRFLYISTGLENHKTARMSFYDLQLNEMPFGRSDYKRFAQKVERPQKFDEMILIAHKLAQNIPFLRVDLYSVNNHIYFSELTFYPNAGYMKFEPKEWDLKIGNWLQLSNESQDNNFK